MSLYVKTFYLDDPIRKDRVYDLFVPEKVTQEVAFFHIHGGGWRCGSRQDYHDPILSEMSRRGYISATTDYRLNVSAVEQLKDCRDAYMHFVNELRKMNRPLKIAVHGGSAGGHLASLLIAALPGAVGEEYSPEKEWISPYCGILESTPASFVPWDEIVPGIWESMQNAAGQSYAENPELYKKLSLDQYIHPGMPPLFFIEGEWEHVFWYPQKIELAKKLAALDCRTVVKVYKNMEHGFLYNFDRPHQREAFEDMLDFMNDKTVKNTVFES